MKVCKKVVKIASILIVILLSLTITVFAYYQYFGKYAAVMTINGKIKVDAFDVLYDDIRSNKEGIDYGTSPENPFVIDSEKRLNNLILLNNTGRLAQSKEKSGIDKYYFCLEFDEEELPQVLNLLNKEFSSIGTNEFEFEDELAGIVYGYPIEMNDGTTEYVFYSGTCKKALISIKYDEEKEDYFVYEYDQLSTHTVDEFTTDPENFVPAEYLFLDKYYNEDSYKNNNRKIEFVQEAKILPVADLTICHQVIANETIVADDEQVDVGFISSIGENGYVHDLILYNEKIICKEEETKGVFNKFLTFFNDLADHVFARDDKSDERHIGFFAGHIDGAANNISIAGSSSFDVDTKSVNYYSDFTTVGYINPNAIINNVPFASLYAENANQGNSWGCLFADNIYELVENKDGGTLDQDNARQYVLTEISAGDGWPGVDEDPKQFAYGSFNFILSNNNDTLNKIWSGDDGFYFLNKNGYTINTNVLYSTSEYRFTDAQTAGGTILNVSASLGEKVYAGVRELDNTGSEIDAGKYAIIAKVVDTTKNGGYAYYALKIAASAVNGVVSYDYDHTDTIDVTDYILGVNNNIYSSAILEVPEKTSQPIFQNSRFDTNWIGTDSADLTKVTKANAQKFEVNTENHSLYFKTSIEKTADLDGDGVNETYEETVANYLNFDKDNLSFYISDSKDSQIYLYYISNGFILREVTSTADLEMMGKYVIVAETNDGVDHYNLLGLKATSDSDGAYTVDRYLNSVDYDLGDDVTHELPINISLLQYETIKPYVWEIRSVNGNAYTFIDDISNSLYLANNANVLGAATNATYWTYNQVTNGATLANNNLYISYQEDNDELNSNYSLQNSAYTLKLYQLVPDDSDPLYITYEAAKYLHADSTTVPAGKYAIVAEHNGTSSLVTLANSDTTISTVNVTISNGVTNNNYLWEVAENSATPTFKNVGRTRYLNQSSNSTANGSSTSKQWMYDAANYYLFYQNGTDTYYLVWDSNQNNVKIVKGLNQSNVNYTIKLYLCETRYTYSGVKIANETYYEYGANNAHTNQNNNRLATYPENRTTNDPYMYILSSKPLNQNTEAQFLIGYRNTDGYYFITKLI